MNCAQAKKIPIRLVLESFSLFPSKVNPKTAFYFALDRVEKTPSLSVDFVTNKAFDFGTGINYDIVSIVQTIKKCSVIEALKYLEQFSSSFQNQTNHPKQKMANLSKSYEIAQVKEIQHPALLEYLKSRRVDNQTEFLNEIHYRMNGKNYFGIGFKNDSNGYEIRNAYSKICLGKKGISMIENGSNSIRIFEGFFDFLSFKNVENYLEKEPSDYIILNSVSMINKIQNSIQNYENIELYFDNDEAGNRAVEMIKNENENAEDCRILYADFKDLNDWLIQKDPKNEVEIQYKSRFKR
ncbi:toprim domain-containing protein [Kaistella jeonii]|uniref:toprim domain-containing protein n=1 Tax=Kaistella jeonii TaxID=266749 RepID=UPI000691DA10|nr:toprim domain-containing protein [Kaistella jeonii]SFB90027.1 Toprim-like [Kaistella jeonii]VEI95819.1 DNA primase (bacterial type) [Kaistella jeonii]